MNPEIKAQWLAALRSGEYEQTTDGLSDLDGFCCLGVLCDLGARAGAVEMVEQDEHGNALYDGEIAYLPPSVRDWAGLPSRYPEVQVEDSEEGFVFTGLADLNDSGRTFAEIADVIEEYL